MGALITVMRVPQIAIGFFGGLTGLILLGTSSAFWIPFVDSLNNNEDQSIVHNFKVSIALTLIGTVILLFSVFYPMRPIM